MFDRASNKSLQPTAAAFANAVFGLARVALVLLVLTALGAVVFFHSLHDNAPKRLANTFKP